MLTYYPLLVPVPLQYHPSIHPYLPLQHSRWPAAVKPAAAGSTRCGAVRDGVGAGRGGVGASRAAVVQLARELCESVRRRRVLLAPLLLLAHVLQPTADADHRRLGRPLTHARACAHKTHRHSRKVRRRMGELRAPGRACCALYATAAACCYRRAGTSVRSCSTVLKLSVDFIRSVFRDCHAIAMTDPAHATTVSHDSRRHSAVAYRAAPRKRRARLSARARARTCQFVCECVLV